MMKRKSKPTWNIRKGLLLFLVAVLSPMGLYAQSDKQLFKGHFYEEDERIEMRLDLYDASLTVPGMEFLGKMHGYMRGNIYGVWMLTSYKIKNEKAVLRFSNDSGADSQTIAFTQINDSTYKYETVGGNDIKRVHKRKLVKIPNELKFIKLK